ncbi:alpha-ketoacid dehydrogenase subunit beta [Meiothermus granaticius]|uniref:2-oxoisovalerate dehydrogenase subunit beta n=1 Tax=Meiothermus granaticius NBRC 107808 TaxID=1227551 RepID=A0A399F9D2_9DEIN|nr:alpha-ketoacid dehydrogenase subunit beta [Meiothermus granaticius]MCL6526522.1 alpha-ketoacid dehydrogenase subunit beta [Thermaceae bacterium]RIH93267.1 2-oxoisovalerate dehydrogenase subunit beta [Meiothermus granaticius NBRC 107808]GEM86414.1 2-oxoisovalerate dehydrogenase subunit beta [Meiothermus granaticius NBRC 107808]
MPTLTMIGAINTALSEEMHRDERVVLFGEDVGKRGGVFLATEGLQKTFGPDRVFDSPLSEAAIIGAAVGMAAHGLRPVAEVQFADYVFPGIDQLFSQAAKLRYRSGGQFTAPMVVRMPTGGGVKGGHHHSQSPEAHFAHTAGLKVVVVSTPYDTKGLLKSAIRDDDPVVFMEPKRLYRALKEEVPEEDYLIPIGKAAVRREGSDITLVSYGGPMLETLKAAEEMAAAGISPEVIDLRSVLPWDKEAVLSSVAKTGRLLMISEAPRTASIASEVTATVSEELFDQLLAPATRVTGFDIPYPYAQDKLYMPTVTRILNAAKRVLDY